MKQATLYSGNIPGQRQQAEEAAILAQKSARAKTAPLEHAVAKLHAARTNTARIFAFLRVIESTKPANGDFIV